MFRALQFPSLGARQTVLAASGFRMNVEVEVFSAVVGLLTNQPWLRTRVLSRGRFVNKPTMAENTSVVASSWVFYLSD